MPACAVTSHPWLTTAELAACALRRDELERRDGFHTGGTATSAECRSLDAPLFAPGKIPHAIDADAHRVNVGLEPRDAERHAVARALRLLPSYYPCANAWQPFIGLDRGAIIIGVERPARPYPGDAERHYASDSAWCVAQLAKALDWLATQVPLTVVAQVTNPDLTTARGASARVRFDRVVDAQVAA